MRLLVVGAGASYAECKAANLPDAQTMPLMKDLSRKLWSDYDPAPFLEVFLGEIGIAGYQRDALEVFRELEAKTPNLIEQFFASAWSHRNELFTPYSRCWDDLMYHGLLRPLNFILLTGLLANNPDCCFPLAESVAKILRPGDLVLNLNYDLIFDVALRNAGRVAAYSPNITSPGMVWVFKPHGSFHLAVSEEKRTACFGQVEFMGDVQPSDGARTFLGFVPPRINKTFVEHPVARAIIAPLLLYEPDIVSFWGVGSPASDVDLFEMYRHMCAKASRVEYINPSEADAKRFEMLMRRQVEHIPTADQWLVSTSA